MWDNDALISSSSYSVQRRRTYKRVEGVVHSVSLARANEEREVANIIQTSCFIWLRP